MDEKKETKGLQWIHKAIFLLLADVLTILFSYFAALLLRFDFAMSTIPREYLVGYAWSMPFWVTAAVVVFYGCRLYHSIWRLASVSELRRILIAYTLLIPIYVAGGFFMRLRMPTSYYIMGYIISFCMTTGIRFSYRLLRFYVNRQDNSRPAAGRDRVMIIGAGRAGQTLIKEMLSSSKMNVQVCCIIDDNPNKKGRVLEGIPIVGNRYDIVDAVKKYDINRIVYAIPATTGKNRKDILNICKDTGCRMQTVPGVYQLVNGEVSVSKLRDVEITDLLGRAQVKVNNDEILAAIRGKTVLVTGAESLPHYLALPIFRS